MSKPDWTEAPDDATHWDTVRDFFCSYAGYWYKGVLFDVNYHIDWNTDRYIERPTGWDSEGYPPIGWHGQARLGGNLTWLECIVLSGHALAVGGEGDWTIEFIFEDKAPEFKPLPTVCPSCQATVTSWYEEDFIEQHGHCADCEVQAI
jgi:hypothetical protein